MVVNKVYFICTSVVLSTWVYQEVTSCATSERTFTVYWNVPSHVCKRHGIYINASKFEIVQNTGDLFHGDKIDINYRPGKFPYLHGNDSVNGGIPQRGCLENHTNAFRRQVEMLPKGFSGPAVIDFEYYLPSFIASPKEYKRASREWVVSVNPNFTLEQIEEEAVKTFNASSRELMETLLRIGNELRPDALWGYYHYPYCKNREGNFNCTPNVLAVNDEIATWLYNTSKALYPSIYVKKEKGFDDQGRKNLVLGRINEALRVRRKLAKHIPIYTYFKGQYKDTDEHLDAVDIVNTIGISRLTGTDGTIIWGSSGDVNSKEKCAAFQENLENTLGPLIQYLLHIDLTLLRRAFRTSKLRKKIIADVLSKTTDDYRNQLD